MLVPGFLLTVATAVLAASASQQDVPSQDKVWSGVTTGCGQSKSCFIYPVNCLETDDCVAAVSILVIGKTYTFEMQSVGGVYVAVGLSDDIKMGNDSIVECVSDNAAAEGKLSLYASFNKGHANTRESEATGLILDNDASSYDSASKTAFCKFTREEVTTFQDVVFDLDKTQYHLILAVGTSATGGLASHVGRELRMQLALIPDTGIGYHDVARPYSEDQRFVADIGYFHNPDSI